MNVAEQTASERYGITGGTAQAISESVEAAIRRRALVPDDVLPPVRSLAEALAVSPNTVAAAYRALGKRGVVVGEGRRGTRVASRPPVRAAAAEAVPDGLIDLANGNPDPTLLPKLPALRRGVAAAPRLSGSDDVDDPALCNLARSRFHAGGIDAGDVVVLGGALDAIERVLAAHLRPGDRVAVEDPGFPPLVDLARAMGLVPVPVAIDAHGMLPESLAAVLDRGADAVVITPRAQNPTGAALDQARAAGLAQLLTAHPGVLLIEDDHAGPVAGAHPVSVCASQPTERWAVVASVSKWLGPDLRVAVMATDADTGGRVAGRRALGAGWVSTILQTLVVDLWSDPALQIVVERAAAEYAGRRAALIEALETHHVEAVGASGLNVWVPVPAEAPVLAATRDAGFVLAAGERFRLASGPGVRISVGGLRLRDVEPLAAALVTGIGSAPAGSRSPAR